MLTFFSVIYVMIGFGCSFQIQGEIIKRIEERQSGEALSFFETWACRVAVGALWPVALGAAIGDEMLK